MKLTRKQFKKIQPCLPKVRGNVRIDQLDFVNALLYVAENGVGCYFQGAARGISRRRGFVCAVAGQYLCESPSRRHGRA